jgi:MOSC domain-containing protein YiiM
MSRTASASPAGQVVAIHVTVAKGEPMQAVARAELVAGRGIAGDRYAEQRGYYSSRPAPDGGRELTLFEAEVLEALARELDIELGAHEHRRNVTTRGVRLDELIGRQFRVGSAVCQGVRPCTPCEYLQGLVGKPILAPLVDRGGLRARVLEGGTIRVGDPIAPVPAPAAPSR